MEQIEFAAKERMFLDALVQCEGTMVTRTYLWAYLYPDPRSRPASMRSVDVVACRVRKKLLSYFDGANCIHQVRNEGYKFIDPAYC